MFHMADVATQNANLAICEGIIVPYSDTGRSRLLKCYALLHVSGKDVLRFVECEWKWRQVDARGTTSTKDFAPVSSPSALALG